MNVDETERYPFLAAEVDLIRRALDLRLPMLGICLGAQLLAKAAGAKVFPNRVKEIGWYSIDLTPAAAADPLFAGCGQVAGRLPMARRHVRLAPGAVHLAASPLCPQQAFRAGPCAYGLQFHVEMTAAMIEDWLGEPGNCGELAELDYIDAEAIRAATPQRLPALEVLARQVFGRFAAPVPLRGRNSTCPASWRRRDSTSTDT